MGVIERRESKAKFATIDAIAKIKVTQIWFSRKADEIGTPTSQCNASPMSENRSAVAIATRKHCCVVKRMLSDRGLAVGVDGGLYGFADRLVN